jgi:uncharacterized protein
MSDTHFRKGFSLESEVLEHLRDSDAVIHCGDFVSIEFYNFLISSGKLIGVRGNNDHLLRDLLPEEQRVNLEGYRIAVTHGHLVPEGSIHYRYPDADIIIYGHSHHPSIERFEGKLILSPGSLTANRYVDYNSFMTINLVRGTVPEPGIVKLLRGGSYV